MPAAALVSRLRKATGMGWLEARIFILGNSATLCDRIIQAKEIQDGPSIHDPIEDQPELVESIAHAKRKSEEALRVWVDKRNAEYRRRGLDHMISERPRGGCHYVWREMKKVLREEYAIEWFTPAEMNPGARFD